MRGTVLAAIAALALVALVFFAPTFDAKAAKREVRGWIVPVTRSPGAILPDGCPPKCCPVPNCCTRDCCSREECKCPPKDPAAMSAWGLDRDGRLVCREHATFGCVRCPR